MINNVYDIVKVLYGTCQLILSYEHNLQSSAMKFVPRKLTNDENECCIAICSGLKEQTETSSPPSLLEMTFGFMDMAEAKQSSQWKTPKFTATQKPH
jgi:hypothetical protein